MKKKPARNKKKTKLGLPPGSLVFTGEQKLENPHITIIRYNANEYTAHPLSGELPQVDPNYITWIDVRGIHDSNLIEDIGRSYSIHPLVLEDIMDVQQRPKYEEYENGFYFTLRNYKFDASTNSIVPEQISIFAGPHFVFSFQEDREELFAEVVTRLETARGKIRFRTADYLVYALLDRIVDGYFLTLDQIGEAVEDLEDEIISDVTRETKSKIHDLKRELLTLRRSLSPVREAIGSFVKSDSEFIDDSTVIFLRDLYDHCIQAFDILETSRDNLTGLQDLYISELGFKANAVMQVLTIVATIFIPLTFLVGIYGMNFDHMPELHYRYSYFILWMVMVIMALSMLYFFRRKKWL
ncbi:MAG: magnesium/cobalt transporter CorA [Saprospiraceae bacterium]|nr:magnesium/cobalt transporter CorA [Saprospiraceae bacterium]